MCAPEVRAFARRRKCDNANALRAITRAAESARAQTVTSSKMALEEFTTEKMANVIGKREMARPTKGKKADDDDYDDDDGGDDGGDDDDGGSDDAHNHNVLSPRQAHSLDLVSTL